MSMFDVGKYYKITTIDGGEQTYATYRIEDVNLPLIQVWVAGSSVIMNTSSLSFVSAELVESDANLAAQEAWHVTPSDDNNAA